MGDINNISETVQEFQGERFYLCGNYFQHQGKRLHRVIWEYYNGEIPEGYHVHHIDENKTHNEIDNLALMPGVEHRKLHNSEEAFKEKSRNSIKVAISVAPEWHGSDEGKAWHSVHAKEMWKNKEPVIRYCTFCGEAFLSRDLGHKGNHFCSGKCKAAYRRHRIASEKNY